MLKVYVAGPLTKWGEHAAVAACVQLNVDKALALGAELVEAGYNPYVPHYSHYLNEFTNLPVSYETWLKLDFEWLEQCDVLFRMPGHSPGADREVEHAAKRNIPVVTTIEALDAFRDFWNRLPQGVAGTRALRHFWEVEYRGPRVSPEPCVSDSEPFMNECLNASEPEPAGDAEALAEALAERIAVLIEQAPTEYPNGFTVVIWPNGAMEIRPLT